MDELARVLLLVCHAANLPDCTQAVLSGTAVDYYYIVIV
jgi:hypothetical protein